MKTAILNTTILTNNGNYNLEEISLNQAKQLLKTIEDENILSAIGHESTAVILTKLLETKIEVNRIMFSQEIGQKAICFKLNGRPPEGKILSLEDLEEIGYSFKLLTRLS